MSEVNVDALTIAQAADEDGSYGVVLKIRAHGRAYLTGVEPRYAALMSRPTLRPALILALVWLLVSVVMTMILAPQLGLRGLAWLAAQDGLCLFGCSWEIRRAWRLQQDLKGTSASG